MSVIRRLSIGCVLVLACAVASPALGAPHQQSNDWELLGAPGAPIARVWAVADGTVVAADSAGALIASGDRGDSWTSIPLPLGGWGLTPDPSAATTVYAVSPAGLHKSADSGQTWNVIRPSATALGRPSANTVALAVSPADSNLLYAPEPLGARLMRIMRSADGGATWTTATEIDQRASPCSTRVSVLVPHPTNAMRLFSDHGCYAGRDFGTRLHQSFDGGSTWSSAFPRDQRLYPRILIGGAGVEPARYYLATAAFMGTGPASLYRTDDEAVTWTKILQADDPRTLDFGGLAYDPAQPDTVFVGTGATPSADDAGVRVTSDGGQTWDILGTQDLGPIVDLARADDGTLFAASPSGLWRLRPDPGV